MSKTHNVLFEITNAIYNNLLNEVSSELMYRAAKKQREVIADEDWKDSHSDEEYERYAQRAEDFEAYADELVVREEVGEYLYHATPSCYINSIKKYGLGGKIPKKRFWDYTGIKYENIKQGVFLATDEYVAESYLEGSDDFEDFAEQYEERYDKELKIVVFEIPVSVLDKTKLTVDKNVDVDSDHTFFYDGIINYKDMKIIEL